MFFVVDRNMPAVEAIKASIDMVRNNVGPLLLFWLATLAITIVGACLCGVGLLVAIPVVVIAQVYTFRTFNNDPVLDREALERYKEFRLEAEHKGFRHFLEVFDPNRPEAVEASQMPGFINDAIVRTLGGVTARGRPVFLKMVYHGPKAMEELVRYDPHLVVGILGGSAGTTYDAFKLLSEAN